MACEDGARTALWMRRELINVEVLSGVRDGPTFRAPCAIFLLINASSVNPRVILLMSAGYTRGCVSCYTFQCCVGGGTVFFVSGKIVQTAWC